MPSSHAPRHRWPLGRERSGRHAASAWTDLDRQIANWTTTYRPISIAKLADRTGNLDPASLYDQTLDSKRVIQRNGADRP
jgi:hypothetical protein